MNPVVIRKLVVFLWVAIALPSTVFARPQFHFTNDVFINGGADRYLSNDFGYSYKLSDDKSVSIRSLMFTPDDLRTPTPPEGDHPYAGYTYIGYSNKNGNRTYEYRIGAVGNASGADELQTFVHRDLGLGTTPQGWDTQEKSAEAFDFIYSHKNTLAIDSPFGVTEGEFVYGARLGNIMLSAFLEQTLSKRFGRCRFLTTMRGDMIGFNRHLEGSLFTSGWEFAVEREPLVATASLGFEFDVSDYVVGFIYSLQTPTFQGQDDNHAFGSLIFRGKL